MLGIIMAMALATQQPAPAGPPPSATEVDKLVIQAKPKLTERQAIESFIDEVADETASERLARWNRRVCVGVVGMSGPHAQFMLDRIAQRFVEVGIDPGEPGCKANVMVVLTDRPDDAAEWIYRRYGETLSRWDTPMTAGRKALNEFRKTDAPVRWWHVARRVTADGTPYSAGQRMRVFQMGRLKSNTRADFDRAIVIIDAGRVGKVRFEALADYVAFVTLAQIDPAAEPTVAPSILTLFSDREAGREPVAAMTDWDRAYVKGLYVARRDALRSAQQKRDIRHTMTGAVDLPEAD